MNKTAENKPVLSAALSERYEQQKREELKRLAREALAVQDACNLSGVAHGMARAVVVLRELVQGGDVAVNTHPIAVLWADKIASLTGTQHLGSDSVAHAYQWAERETRS